MSQGWTRDNDDGDKFELERNGEAAPSSAPVLRNLDAPGPSTLVRQVVTDCVFQHKSFHDFYHYDHRVIFVCAIV